MVFYELELLSLPQILFACSVEYDKYANRFSHPEDYLEISVCEQGRILFSYGDGSREIVSPGMLIPIFSDISCETSAFQNEKQRHSTVGVRVKYKLRRYSSERECDLPGLRERMKSGCIILIPYHEDMKDIYTELIHTVKKISAHSFSDSPGGRANALSQWYKLLGMLTEFVFKRLNEVSLEIPPSQLLYAAKAEKYIVDNYSRRISVSDIAARLEISEGYLHRIFRAAHGVGITEYINNYRVNVAIDLMQNRGLSLKEAALNVGIEDSAYMSRLFRKVTGVSCREYFSVNTSEYVKKN
ncbi:MAG: helix-turn-helix transcriptional regulator [Clostridia bacterium]|nr:helix-turn-helix transcriptional regulator [Clostridia bacterium]